MCCQQEFHVVAANRHSNPNWRDQLTAVNGVGITYDQIGNPLNDGEWTYTWENGRQLARMQSIDADASFVYNKNGLRVQKTANGVVTDYTLHGKNVVHIYMVEREIQSADILSCGFATFVPKTFGAGFFHSAPRRYRSPKQADNLLIVQSTHITIIVRKRRKSLANPRKPLILLRFRHPCPARESTDDHPGKPRNSISKGLSHPLQPPKRRPLRQICHNGQRKASASKCAKPEHLYISVHAIVHPIPIIFAHSKP